MKLSLRTRSAALMSALFALGFSSEASAQYADPNQGQLVAANDPWVQPNGDYDAYPLMVHIPIALGVGIPFGSIDGGGAAFSDTAGTFTNFELGAGLRVGRFVGDLMFSFGGAGLQSGAETSIRSAGYDPGGAFRAFFGVDGAYYLARTPSWAPWVGGRIGYEVVGVSGSSGSQNLSSAMGGLYLAARTGADWRITQSFGLGAFLELGVGRFMTGSVSTYRDDDPTTSINERAASEDSTDIDFRGGAFHGYFGLGLRVVFFP